MAVVTPAMAIGAAENAFRATSNEQMVALPISHLHFESPLADVHVKGGHRINDEFYVLKVASSHYENPKIGIPSSNGLMLVFDVKTGVPCALLNDEGWLTDYRTAAAGAVCAKLLARSHVKKIGIIGAGTQARFQLDLLREVVACREAVIWARRTEQAQQLAVPGFSCTVASSVEALCAECDLVVTTTPSRTPLIRPEFLRPGMHITAVGADAPGKQELDAGVFGNADVRAVDSKAQCFDYGDSASVVRTGLLSPDMFCEIGTLLERSDRARTNDDQITVADLTGLGAQDVELASAAYRALLNR